MECPGHVQDIGIPKQFIPYGIKICPDVVVHGDVDKIVLIESQVLVLDIFELRIDNGRTDDEHDR